jgi:putative ABC transport system ATP-binding protein
MSLYELTDVRRIYRTGGGEVRALDGIDLTIDAAEFMAIEGPSGSGKSTLLQLLGALDKATSGTVSFDGRELATLGDRELTQLRAEDIGFVFQNFNLIPTLTAAQNVEAALVGQNGGRASRHERAMSLLEQVGLAPRATHLPTLLSGGEQQRVAIARALANAPRVILADEPTGNLDSVTADEVVDVLRGLSLQQGVTVILVTHAEESARRVGRRVLAAWAVGSASATAVSPSKKRALPAPAAAPPLFEGFGVLQTPVASKNADAGALVSSAGGQVHGRQAVGAADVVDGA